MRLYVAEKKDVATAIVAALGNKAEIKKGYYELAGQYQVTWAWGHLLTLLDPEDVNPSYKKWSLDALPMCWPVDLKPIEKTRHQLQVIWRLMENATEIINACDPDSAGQRIFQDIYNTAPRKPHTVSRALFNDNNTNAILKAIENTQPNENFNGLYLEDLTRAVSDQRIGYNMTRLITTKAREYGVSELFTVGRVQSCILALVTMRTRNKKNHQAAYYYTVNANLNTPHGDIRVKLNPHKDLGFELDHEDRFVNQEEIIRACNALNDGSATLTDIKRRTAKDSPPLPHDLLSLQIEASRIFGIRPEETLDITQKLRDKQAITYNRSDTRYLTNENFEQAGFILGNLASLDQYRWINQSGIDPKRKSRAFNDSKTTAHHALMPTGNVSEYHNFSQNERRIFALIARNFVIQFMPKRERIVTNLEVEIKTLQGDSYTFVGKTSRTTFAGWETLYAKDREAEGVATSPENEDEPSDTGIDTTHLMAGTPLRQYTVEHQKQQTKPAPLYTMETLLRDLQNTAKYLNDAQLKQFMIDKDKDNDDAGGIGTPATRSDIIKRLFEVQLLTETNDKKPKILATEKGEALYDLLPQRITSPELTAIWANEFINIRAGTKSKEDFWNELDTFIATEVFKVKEDGLKLPDFFIKKYSNNEQKNTQDCPLCSTSLTERKGKFGPFFRCQQCDRNFSSYNRKLIYSTCSECGSEMKLIKPKNKGKGKAKAFLGCTNYPDCKNTEQL
ncbi:DNA topoisomerase [Vibrio sp. PNB22_3_1]